MVAEAVSRTRIHPCDVTQELVLVSPGMSPPLMAFFSEMLNSAGLSLGGDGTSKAKVFFGHVLVCGA